MKTLSLRGLLLSSIIISSSGCALMLPERSFIEEMERDSDSFFSPGKDFPVVSGDSGRRGIGKEEMRLRTPASERSKKINAETLSVAKELEEKEGTLEEFELEQYAQDKKFLQTDSDKLYYLSLSINERVGYIKSKQQDLKDELEERANMLQRRSIHSSEIFLGMDKDEVVAVWGKPARIEIAGNPMNQNERWSFVEDGNVKQVYFEGGKVHGWALDL